MLEAQEPPRDLPPIRIVLARLDGTEQDAVVLAHAGFVARHFAAHVRAVHVPSSPPTIRELAGFATSSPNFGLKPSAEQLSSKAAAAAKGAFTSWMAIAGLTATDEPGGDGKGSAAFELLVGEEPAVLAQAGQLADLIVTPRPSGAASLGQTLALETVLFNAGRPVLIVPPKAREPDFANPVIGWNASPQAARALAAALPLLRVAPDPAAILSVPEKHEASPEAVAAYLARHGISAEIAAVAKGVPGNQLVQLARSRKTGLLVCGAYTHGRFRQALFGGVTTLLIESADVPVLLSF